MDGDMARNTDDGLDVGQHRRLAREPRHHSYQILLGWAEPKARGRVTSATQMASTD